MGSLTDANIAAWQKASGIKPAQGKLWEILEKMSQAAYELIKVIELERSGIRDGDGYWHGTGEMDHAAGDLVCLIEAWDEETRPKSESVTSVMGDGPPF
jgi:hypothetical protein